MRLICPRCGAQYEIDDDAIPSGGRAVECSACEHVWRAGHDQLAPRPGAPQQPRPATTQVIGTPVAAPLDYPGFDPSARPVLSRKLDDSVLDILREEAARELDARAAQRNAARAAERTATALAGIEATRTPRSDAGSAAAEMQRARPDAPTANAPVAAPVTDSETGTAVRSEPGTGTGHDTGTGAGTGHAVSTGTDDALAPAPASPPAAALPARTDPRLHLAAAMPAAANPQADTARRRTRARRRHDTGFHVAVMAALVAVALYALAPRLADQGAMGEGLMRWHAQVNEARDWLAVQGDRLIATLPGA